MTTPEAPFEKLEEFNEQILPHIADNPLDQLDWTPLIPRFGHYLTLPDEIDRLKALEEQQNNAHRERS